MTDAEVDAKLAALYDVLKMETSIRDGVSFTAIEFLASSDADLVAINAAHSFSESFAL